MDGRAICPRRRGVMSAAFDGQTGAPPSGGGRKLMWIVLGSLLLLFVLCIGTCMVFRDDFTRAAIAYGAKDFRRAVEADSSLVLQYPTFGTLTDSFVTRVQNDSIKQEPNAQLDFVTAIQTVHQDTLIDASDVQAMASAMVRFFPDLAQYWNPTPATPNEPSSSQPVDSTIQPIDTVPSGGE